jgi:light-regulated signal transduction histidine kinase (bacteriophytochrome)
MDMQNKVIEQQNTEINKSNQTLQKTFSIISHDLRNPFNALLGYSTLLIVKFHNIVDGISSPSGFSLEA